MATVFEMRFNLDQALRDMNITLTNGIKVAGVRAINRTADSEKTALSRAVAADMGLKVGTVKNSITVEKATVNQPEARVIARGKPIPLIEFSARGPEPSRGRGRGVSYRNPGSPRNRAEHAFITTLRSGHRGVFERNTSKRLPIRELMGPSVAHVFQKLVPVGEARRQEVLIKNLEHEIAYALQRGA